jgi:hypothetical protein
MGIAIDVSAGYRAKSNLQASVDFAALNAGREIGLIGTGDRAINSLATQLITSQFSASSSELTVSAVLDKDERTLQVSASTSWQPYILDKVGFAETEIAASATAKLMSSGNICVIGLNRQRGKTVRLQKNARLVGNNCGVYSNSNNKSSIQVDKGSVMDASFICSAGGIKGREEAKLRPTPVVDCPAVQDPLSARKQPVYGGCMKTKLEIKNRRVTLMPGVYCGGIAISGTSKVTLSPGEYIIKDGKFEIKDSASLDGVGVGIFLTGKGAKIFLDKDTSISLTAPEAGPMAGILFWEDRLSKGEAHKITSNDARVLLGTIYLPKGNLLIDAEGQVADKSAYTAIVVNSLFLEWGPTLTLNSNYTATNVPIPNALLGGAVRLVE